MRRKTRKAVINLSLFLLVFFLIIYLTRAQPLNTKFSWSKIRYKTTSKNLPPSHGICPDLSSTTKPALIIARISSDDSAWLTSLSTKYHLCPYTSDASSSSTNTHLRVPANRGHEAMAYLTFIIDNYDNLPAEGMVFVHGSRFAWHNDSPFYDNLELLNALNITSALGKTGYHNLRCDWSLSTCPRTKDVLPQGGMETKIQAVLVPFDSRAVSDAALPGALASLFGAHETSGAMLGRNDGVVRSQCCAQFVVSRESVWRHEREEYVALRQWLLDGSKGSVSKNKNAAPADDKVAGRILSYIWHILFLNGENDEVVDLEKLNEMACPSAGECYCRLYGRCNLKDCVAGSCERQYSLPGILKLPEDWVATHG